MDKKSSNSGDWLGYRSDGGFVPVSQLNVSILDLGWIHSDSTYDVCHVKDGRFFRLDWHLDRFFGSAAGLALEIPYDRERVTEILKECVRRSAFPGGALPGGRLSALPELKDAFVWMVCTRGVPESGNPRDLKSCRPRFLAYAKPYYGIKVGAGEVVQPISLTISNQLRFPKASLDPALKSFHWGDLTAAQLEADRAGVDSAVLVDGGGNLTEGPGFNFFWVGEGRVGTPSSGVLQGVTRRAVLAICEEEGIAVDLRNPSPEEVRGADEVFITSTSGGITPVSRLDQKDWDAPGPVTQRLSDLYWRKHEDPKWTMEV